MRSRLTGLECRACCTQITADSLVGVCPSCGHALLATYDLEELRGSLTPEAWHDRPGGVWRYRELLPVRSSDRIVSLGEAESPVIKLGETRRAPGIETWVKDDGGLPTGAFKAREMTVAISRAVELGATSVFLPSTGNAGIAASAYGARARVPVRVYLTEATAPEAAAACRSFGATVRTVRGTMSDARRSALEQEPGRGSVELSTMREPYRVEGTKTMGFEMFDRFGAAGMPDAIVYPTGGGLGLVGMFKAFTELRGLGWLERYPRLIAVQSGECAPIIRALREGRSAAEPWAQTSTFAGGLSVPSPFSSERVLEAIRWSGGTGTTVSNEEIAEAELELASEVGLTSGVEGAATYAALPRLIEERAIRPGERVLLYLTGAGFPFSLHRLSSRAPTPAMRRPA